VTRLGDLWHLGEHRVFCGDALQAESYARVLGTEKAEMAFADVPYNVVIDGHASGLGAVKHADFVMASGELSPAEYESFLKTSLGHAAGYSIDGAIHFACTDWRLGRLPRGIGIATLRDAPAEWSLQFERLGLAQP